MDVCTYDGENAKRKRGVFLVISSFFVFWREGKRERKSSALDSNRKILV